MCDRVKLGLHVLSGTWLLNNKPATLFGCSVSEYRSYLFWQWRLTLPEVTLLFGLQWGVFLRYFSRLILTVCPFHITCCLGTSSFHKIELHSAVNQRISEDLFALTLPLTWKKVVTGAHRTAGAPATPVWSGARWNPESSVGWSSFFSVLWRMSVCNPKWNLCSVEYFFCKRKF